jgi:hypothetical protein
VKYLKLFMGDSCQKSYVVGLGRRNPRFTVSTGPLISIASGLHHERSSASAIQPVRVAIGGEPPYKSFFVFGQ